MLAVRSASLRSAVCRRRGAEAELDSTQHDEKWEGWAEEKKRGGDGEGGGNNLGCVCVLSIPSSPG